MLQVEARFPPKLKFLFQPARYKVLHGGRGGAKSWGIARALLIQGANQPLRVLCAREFQNSIKDSVHKLLGDQVSALQLGDFYEVQEKVIKGANGTEFAFEGLRQNASRIRSFEGVDRCWIEEGQAVSKASWDTLIPTIRKDGSEIWVSFNPEFEDDDTFARFLKRKPTDAKVCEINWRDNPWFPKVLDQERKDLKRDDPDSYDHVWEGKCRQWLEGAIYSNELRKAYEQKRICAVAYDPAVPVFTAWDLGRTDDTAIWWFQIVKGEIHILESYASSGGTLSEYATQILGRKVEIDLVKDEVVAKIGALVEDLQHRTAYKYATHWLPHDARAKTLAAKGKSIIEQLAAALTWDRMSIVPDIGLEDGIQAARMTFGRCWFDLTGCEDGLKALRRYKRQLQSDERSLHRNPKHDWTSHYSDAFRMLAVAWREAAAPLKKPTAREEIIKAAKHVPTFDELVRQHDERHGGRARV